MLAQKVPKGFPYLEAADDWGILSSPAAELTEEEDLEQRTALGAQEEDSDMSRAQLTVNALKKGVQVADTSYSHFFEFDQFMDRCLNYKHQMEAVVTLCSCVRLYRWHSNQDHPFLYKSSVCPSTMHSALCDHLYNIQLVTGVFLH
jgi:hypothetical protein